MQFSPAGYKIVLMEFFITAAKEEVTGLKNGLILVQRYTEESSSLISNPNLNLYIPMHYVNKHNISSSLHCRKSEINK